MTKQSLISLLVVIAINCIALLVFLFLKNWQEYLHPERFWLLLLIPFISIWFILRNKKSHTALGFPKLIDQWKQMLPQLVQHFFFGLRVLALVAIIMAAARPQSSTSYENMTREGIDIVLALDLSASMLSKDFEPNRLESSKEVAIQFVDERPDDRIAVVVYEGESFTQVPLTTDHVVVKNGIKQLNTGMVEGGTAIGMGLATAVNRLKESDGESKVVILLTDGVNNSGQIKPADAAQLAKLYGIRVYTIGVGTIGKAKSPVGIMNGQYVYDWVEVEIDEATLRQIAEATGGKYFRATSQNKLRDIYTEIDQLEKTRFNVLQYNRKTEEFKPLVLLALLLIVIEFVFQHTLFRTVS
jgi:Ca-activated chloride channel homolog